MHVPGRQVLGKGIDGFSVDAANPQQGHTLPKHTNFHSQRVLPAHFPLLRSARAVNEARVDT